MVAHDNRSIRLRKVHAGRMFSEVKQSQHFEYTYQLPDEFITTREINRGLNSNYL